VGHTDDAARGRCESNGVAALALAWAAARGIAEGSPDDQRLRVRVLGGGILGMVAILAGRDRAGLEHRLIDLGPTIYARTKMDAPQPARIPRAPRHAPACLPRGMERHGQRLGKRRRTFPARERQRSDASDRGDMGTQIMAGLAPVAARPGASSALVIGFGSGVTARVLSDVPA